MFFGLCADSLLFKSGIEGPEGTVYGKGAFILKIEIPERCAFFIDMKMKSPCLTQQMRIISSFSPYNFTYEL
jgi:hypothetical protein